MGESPRKLLIAQVVINSPSSKELEGLLPCSQAPATALSLELLKFSPTFTSL
jgi:hypothetical protein